MAKSAKDSVAIVYVGQKNKDGEAAPEFVKFHHAERPYKVAIGKSVKGFTRAEALLILDNANTWKINAKLTIKELVVEEDEEESEEEAEEGAEVAETGEGAPKRRGRKPKNG